MLYSCSFLGAVYYLFAAYTEKAFLLPNRLFKHPLIIKSYEQVTAQLNATSFEERNQKGKAGVLKRRKFIQNMMLGFTIPLLSGARGNCRCCGDLCLGPFFKSEEEKNENDH